MEGIHILSPVANEYMFGTQLLRYIDLSEPIVKKEDRLPWSSLPLFDPHFKQDSSFTPAY